MGTRGVGVNRPPCHGGDRRFKSGRVRHNKCLSRNAGAFVMLICHDLNRLLVIANWYNAVIGGGDQACLVVYPVESAKQSFLTVLLIGLARNSVANKDK
jgi:hypothetical protein